MKEEIRARLNNPRQLELLYRSDRKGFEDAFNLLYPELAEHIVADCWNERLNYSGREVISSGSRKELLFVLVAALLAGLIAKLPALLSIDEDFFYPRNIGFIVFPLLTIYFAWKRRLSLRQGASVGAMTLISLVFINLLPNTKQSDTLILACIHLPIVLWFTLGYAFAGGYRNHIEKRLAYLTYNGDLIVMTTLILIAGMLLSGITVGLFSLIGLDIGEFYFQNIGVGGAAAAPIVAGYLTQANPGLVGRVSPVIARIFTPLVLAMLLIYLTAIVYSGKNPYNDREFLLIFNVLLVGVLAIIFFSIIEMSKRGKSRLGTAMLSALAILTMVVNAIALSAILMRIAEWGITPNRIAVLGSNVLVLVNLVLVTGQLLRAHSGKIELTRAASAIVRYMPIYLLWALVVTFLFPFLFGFR